MANHRRKTPTLKSLSRRQWIRIIAVIAAVAMLAGAAVVSRNFYQQSQQVAPVTEFSATDNGSTVSRGGARGSLGDDTSYVTVKINGKSRTVLGTDFTDVKSVLEQGDIVLDPSDEVTPSLTTKVTESTVITIERAGATLDTNDTVIACNTVKNETAVLPNGTEKVQQEGTVGTMETTSLVTRAGGKVVESNVFASYVKTAPTDKIVLVGTGSTSSSSSSTASSSSSLGTTVPASEMQTWAHDYLIANGYTENDFTAAVYIINHESGWNPRATNPSSGAYGLPQALPGSKMASAGADWATNYQTQFKWFVGYCNSRYGGITGAYNHWLSAHSY